MNVHIGPLLECVEYLPHEVMKRCIGTAAEDNLVLRFPLEPSEEIAARDDLDVNNEDFLSGNYITFQKIYIPPRTIWRRIYEGPHKPPLAGLKDPRE
jgi:hypothetical protein